MHLADNIDLTSGLLGGCILGASTSALLFATGKITGISGMFENIVVAEIWHGNFFYILGLCSAGMGLSAYRPGVFGDSAPTSHFKLAVAGILVGFGTRLGSGCTSGHGLCGLSRLSPRSLAAVMTFMTTGAATSFVSNNTKLLDFLNTSRFAHELLDSPQYIYVAVILLAAYNGYFWFKRNKLVLPKLNMHFFLENVAYFLAATIFGVGLGISGMCDPARVVKFLDFSGAGGWDPSLAGVMGGGVLVNLVSNWYLHKAGLDAPLSTSKTKHSAVLKMGLHESNTKIDSELLVGSALFGVGWGLCGMCPGPAVVAWAGMVPNALYFVPAMMTGIALQQQFSRIRGKATCSIKKK